MTDCYGKESPLPQSQTDSRARGDHSQDGFSQQEEAGPLFLPHLNRLHETFHMCGEDTSNSVVTPIPTGQNYLAGPSTLEDFSEPPASLHSLTPNGTAPSSHVVPYPVHNRGLSLTD